MIWYPSLLAQSCMIIERSLELPITLYPERVRTTGLATIQSLSCVEGWLGTENRPDLSAALYRLRDSVITMLKVVEGYTNSVSIKEDGSEALKALELMLDLETEAPAKEGKKQKWEPENHSLQHSSDTNEEDAEWKTKVPFAISTAITIAMLVICLALWWWIGSFLFHLLKHLFESINLAVLDNIFLVGLCASVKANVPAMMKSSAKNPALVTFWDVVGRAPIKEELKRFGILPSSLEASLCWGAVISADKFVEQHGDVYDVAHDQWRPPTVNETIKLRFLSYDVEVFGTVSMALGAVILVIPAFVSEIALRALERFLPISVRQAHRQVRRSIWIKTLRISAVILPILWHSLLNFIAWLTCTVPATAKSSLGSIVVLEAGRQKYPLEKFGFGVDLMHPDSSLEILLPGINKGLLIVLKNRVFQGWDCLTSAAWLLDQLIKEGVKAGLVIGQNALWGTKDWVVKLDDSSVLLSLNPGNKSITGIAEEDVLGLGVDVSKGSSQFELADAEQFLNERNNYGVCLSDAATPAAARKFSDGSCGIITFSVFSESELMPKLSDELIFAIQGYSVSGNNLQEMGKMFVGLTIGRIEEFKKLVTGQAPQQALLKLQDSGCVVIVEPGKGLSSEQRQFFEEQQGLLVKMIEKISLSSGSGPAMLPGPERERVEFLAQRWLWYSCGAALGLMAGAAALAVFG
ncbi:MAG: hypothetical protein NT033_08885, partial [Candidatus Omnitrophica bacterium]|nr:hypothetical protein [Candidatus Omnitrophota bacterium]